MDAFELIFGAGLVIFSLGLMVVFNPFLHKRFYKRLRQIEAVESLKKASGLSVEEGKRLHISLGSASLLSPQIGSALVGLNVLERLSQVSIASDNPPTVTSGEGALSMLSQATLKSSYESGNALDPYAFDQARLSGTTPFAYAAGSLATIQDDKVSSNILIGHFGPEVALMSDAVERQGTRLIAASDAMEGQAVIYGATKDVLIGEELFALPAYIKSNPFQQTSLRVQDILRWVIIGGILAGTVFKIIQIIFGGSGS